MNYRDLNDIYGVYDNYTGMLGAIYDKSCTKFRLWAPLAESAILVLYDEDRCKKQGKCRDKLFMKSMDDGTWYVELKGDMNGIYYNFIVKYNDIEEEVVDPYAKAVAVNGKRGMIIDLKTTNPDGWDKDIKPKLNNAIDSIIYEMHIRDFSIDINSGVNDELRGKYLGACELGTTVPNTTESTCMDYVKSLGVTHVQLMPIEDYESIDESIDLSNQYNWGYDPQNYNVPEGSYSTNPFDCATRIREVKEMIKRFHEAGIRVVMDVVYNHTYMSENSNLNKAVPYYYYREKYDGSFSNGSSCGNEIASERKMVRKFIVDSVLYWAEEYHIDGFRFDLMGLIDITTLKDIRRGLDKIDKSILMYGEGWMGGISVINPEESGLKKNIKKFGKLQIGSFNDDCRDGIKGKVFNIHENGFASGRHGLEDTIKMTITGAVYHSDIDYSKVIYSNNSWVEEPYQTINYVSCHDNNTLRDKIFLSYSENIDDIKSITRLCASIVITSQGIPFFQAGEEFLRTKINEYGSLIDNSYNSSDNVNKIDWNLMIKNKDVVDYYKGLISLRKSHKGFRMDNAQDIRNNIYFMKKGTSFNNDNVVGYMIDCNNIDDEFRKIIVIFNANNFPVHICIPMGKWKIYSDGIKASDKSIGQVSGTSILVNERSCYILAK